MIDIVRSQYGYTDEYILTKTFTWLKNAVELISRRTYNQTVFETELLVSQIAGVYSGKFTKLKSYEDLLKQEKETKEFKETNLSKAMKKYQ